MNGMFKSSCRVDRCMMCDLIFLKKQSWLNLQFSILFKQISAYGTEFTPVLEFLYHVL
jgi:hypothetical protein